MEITKEDLKYMGIFKESLGKKLSKDFDLEGQVLSKLIQNDTKKLFPGRVIKLTDQDLFYTTTVAVYEKLLRLNSPSSGIVIMMQELLDNPDLLSSENLKTLSIIDFNCEGPEYISKKKQIQKLICAWLKSGKSLILLKDNQVECKFDRWFNNHISSREVRITA